MTKLDSIAPVLFLVMWSSGAVIVKFGLQYSTHWSFLALRAVISLVCISLVLLIAKRFTKMTFTTVTKTELKPVLVAGLMLQILYLAFYISAIGSGMSPGLVTLVLGIQPLITPLLCRQRTDRAQTLLLLIGFAGLCIAIAGGQSLQQIGWSGLMFAVLALFALTLGTIKQAKVSLNSIQAMWFQCLLATSVFTLLSLAQGWHVEWNGKLIFSVLWMSIVGSVGAVLLLMYMVKRDSSDKVSVLFYAVPMLTYLFDHLLFGTTLTAVTLVGMVIVACSIVLYRRQSSVIREYDNSSVASQNSR